MRIQNTDRCSVPEDVQEMAEYAYEMVPLYYELGRANDLDWVEFDELPLVGKDIYINANAPYLSTAYVTQYLKGKLYTGKTSGSTGKVTNYYWSYADQVKSLMELWYYRRKYYNILPKDKMSYFYAIAEEKEETIESEHVLGFSKAFLYNGRLREVYERILEYRPKWMILQPSVAWMICQMVQQEGLPVLDSLQYIEFTGEYLEENIRKAIEEFFQCKTANQYGMAEVNSIAYECPYGHMHVMGTNVYVETLNAGEDAIGDICITSLKNIAMPYIRYITGDKGKLIHVNCACGNSNPVLIVTNGRANDWIRKRNGTVLHPYSLLQVISDINEKMDAPIIQYQILQKEFNYFLFRLVTKTDMDIKKMEHMLCEMTAKRLQENITLELEYHEQLIPDFNTGKIAAFLCEIKE